MNAKTENDMRALLPALLADSQSRNETRQQTTARIIGFIKKCDDINAAAVGVALPEPTEHWKPKIGDDVEFTDSTKGRVIDVNGAVADVAWRDFLGCFVRVSGVCVEALRPAPSVSPTEETKP